jgi:4-amino-4-deoxy-L-arabinose transferase-like glycosyltransferase
VTTIPAAAYLGVAAGLGELTKSLGALGVLCTNVAMMVLGATLMLWAQRLIERRGSLHLRALVNNADSPNPGG